MRLKDKVAVITGGNSGIGLATALEFHREGASIAIFGRNRETLDAASAQLGKEAIGVQGDIRKLADIDRLFAETKARFGRADIIVANAGIAKFAPVATMSEELFDELNDILYKGAFF